MRECVMREGDGNFRVVRVFGGFLLFGIQGSLLFTSI